MSKLRRVAIGLLLVASITLSHAGETRAAICGFAGLTAAAGTVFAPAGYVVLFSVAPPFSFTGIGVVPLGTPMGDACMDIWRDSTLGPAPPNFNAVYAAAPAGCASATCTIPTSACSPATVCLVYP